MIAVEGILEYSELPSEPLSEGKIKPAAEEEKEAKPQENDGQPELVTSK